MQLPMTMDFTSGDALELTQQEASLYGTMDRVRQMTNAGIRRFVGNHRELLQGRLLDYGAGKVGTCRIPQPFRSLINAEAYHPWEPGDPTPTGVFDAILCTQVLQSVEDPQELMCEFRKLLKKGGALVITYPVTWEPIEKEFWRFTPKGIWLLTHIGGFKIITSEILAQVTLDGSLTLPLVAGAVAVRA